MKDLSDLRFASLENQLGPAPGKVANPNEPFRLQDLNRFAQVLVASFEKSQAFRPRQFVRCAVAAGFFHKCQRAIVQHQVFPEKILGGPKSLCKESPQSLAADLRTGAFKTADTPPRVLTFRPADFSGHLQPVANRPDFAKGHARLDHAKGTGVHPQEYYQLWPGAESAQIHLVRGPGIFKGVVYVGNGSAEPQAADNRVQPLCRAEQLGNACVV